MRTKNKKGFTLLEVVISLTIMSVVAVASLAFSSYNQLKVGEEAKIHLGNFNNITNGLQSYYSSNFDWRNNNNGIYPEDSDGDGEYLDEERFVNNFLEYFREYYKYIDRNFGIDGYSLRSGGSGIYTCIRFNIPAGSNIESKIIQKLKKISYGDGFYSTNCGAMIDSSLNSFITASTLYFTYWNIRF